MTDQGKVEVHFVDQIHRQLRLLGIEPGWDVAGLTNWLDRQIPHPDIVRTESTLFIHRVLTGLVESRGLTIDQLAGQKFRLRTAIADKIDQHRRAAAVQAYQRALFSADAEEIEVSPEVCFDYSEDRYSPNWYYERDYDFRKHFFPLVGELKGEGEEYECAVFLDQLDAVKYWVRNLERRADVVLLAANLHRQVLSRFRRLAERRADSGCRVQGRSIFGAMTIPRKSAPSANSGPIEARGNASSSCRRDRTGGRLSWWLGSDLAVVGYSLPIHQRAFSYPMTEYNKAWHLRLLRCGRAF